MAKPSSGDTEKRLGPKQGRELVRRFRVTSGDGFKLKKHDPAEAASNSIDKGQAKDLLADGVRRLSHLQELLYANGTWSLLVVFQAMDAAGKDSTIKHVMSGVNPQGVSVTAFKQPGPEDLAHDFLWRVHRVTPARGMIGIFNRSHYEEVLIARVHPDIVARQHLPPSLTGGKTFWDDRLDDIACFERYLARQGTLVLKFFLNVSRDEQKRRFLARLDEPEKNWKFSASDVEERGYWDSYQAAYEAAIAATAHPDAPWFVVPADQKWFARLVVVEAINDALGGLDLAPVTLPPAERERLAEARAVLEKEGS